MVKKTIDLNVKHFSKYGEFLVSFELSKRGWNVYTPMYDEYIDLLIHKYSCKKCGQNWSITPNLRCSKCKKDFSKTSKKDIIAKKKCNKCGTEYIGNISKCKRCNNFGSDNFINIPTCNSCKGEVKLINFICNCGSQEYVTKFRTIQVKSSRIEYKNNISKNTYAVDHKPRDIISCNNHFFIWCLIDETDKPTFLIMSVRDFVKTMGDSMRGISFLKDQDRQHFSSKSFGRWKKFRDAFDKLE